MNGQNKTADWVEKIGEDGAVIRPENLTKLADLIQRDEWQREQNAKLYATTQQYESLTHKIGEQEYRGAEAFRQLQAERAMLDASGGKMLGVLADPAFVTNLALAYQQGDQAQVNAILAPMIEQVKFAGDRAQFDALRQFAKQEVEQNTATTTQQTQVQEFASLIAQIGKALPALTPDDLGEMQDYFAQMPDKIFRPATAAEAQQFGVRVGQTIRDPSLMNQWAQSRATRNQKHAAELKAYNAAFNENAARQPAPVPPKKPAKTANRKPAIPAKEAQWEGDDGSYQAWKRQMERGKHVVEDDET
ncbi:MAG: hypothetical protein NUW01_03150 [Gemmatimonadaceae bacterium]|nr:hypothetical protein [Gemmatimonadaceae bacterium]